MATTIADCLQVGNFRLERLSCDGIRRTGVNSSLAARFSRSDPFFERKDWPRVRFRWNKWSHWKERHFSINHSSFVSQTMQANISAVRGGSRNSVWGSTRLHAGPSIGINQGSNSGSSVFRSAPPLQKISQWPCDKDRTQWITFRAVFVSRRARQRKSGHFTSDWLRILYVRRRITMLFCSSDDLWNPICNETMHRRRRPLWIRIDGIVPDGKRSLFSLCGSNWFGIKLCTSGQRLGVIRSCMTYR